MDDRLYPVEEATSHAVGEQIGHLALLIAREVSRELLKSAMAAALADPDVDEGAKSLAGYVLKWLEDNKGE